jgi:hypothetical protein
MRLIQVMLFLRKRSGLRNEWEDIPDFTRTYVFPDRVKILALLSFLFLQPPPLPTISLRPHFLYHFTAFQKIGADN